MTAEFALQAVARYEELTAEIKDRAGKVGNLTAEIASQAEARYEELTAEIKERAGKVCNSTAESYHETGSEELHVKARWDDLRDEYAQCEFTVPDPAVSYREQGVRGELR